MKQILAAFLLLIVTGLHGAFAQETTISPELLEQVEALETLTRTIRELDGEVVERRFPTRDEVIVYLRNSIDLQLPIEEAERYERFYVALGLLEPDVDLREVYLTLLSAQVAGFYDSEEKVMNVIPLSGELAGELSVTEQIFYVHEYAHALQDQFFDLTAMIESEEVAKHPDRSIATLSLIEGDASAVMQVYMNELVARNPFAAFQVLGEALQSGGLFLPPGTPGVIARELLFPYEGGMLFVLAVYNEGGWDAVDAAYANPPVTAEQVMHPQAFIEGEQPVDVSLADGETVLGEGWTRSWDTRLGEWYLREHLRTQQLTEMTPGSAAAGWGGDDFHVYYNTQSGELAWALRLAWDTPEDAAEFESAYSEFGAAKYGGTPTNGCWTGADDATCLTTLDGDTLITSAPTLEGARALVAANV